ncbi:biotin--[acetyl-CoA-carboxylase] ligase [Ramlibacter sp. AN1015]|uniref:biotin--[acetyl-CoA-carboxylase] ligase n=1 Tax=Ramlibacter sp. AN1015 TaxID=3133428 RepID=UPI0030C29F72
MNGAIDWPAQVVGERLAALLPGARLEIAPTIDSTNSELMRRARAGHCDAVLLVAEQQTAGRGRLGRSWQSAVGDSLTCSLGLPLAPQDWSGLSLAAGVAVAEALHAAVELKWPNDLWIGGRKLGGILVETATASGGGALRRHAVIGVGINIAARSAQGLSTAAAALRELWPDADAGAVLARVGPALLQALLEFERAGFDAFAARFATRDLLRGRPVVLSDGTVGTACGVTGQGALLVHTAAGMISVTSSEVSVRPAPAA